MAVEPLSPELVLVCPELREQALAATVDPVWELVVRARVQAAHEPSSRSSPRLYRGVAAYLAQTMVVPLVAVTLTLTLTLLLTAIANALR